MCGAGFVFLFVCFFSRQAGDQARPQFRECGKSAAAELMSHLESAQCDPKLLPWLASEPLRRLVVMMKAQFMLEPLI